MRLWKISCIEICPKPSFWLFVPPLEARFEKYFGSEKHGLSGVCYLACYMVVLSYKSHSDLLSVVVVVVCAEQLGCFHQKGGTRYEPLEYLFFLKIKPAFG